MATRANFVHSESRISLREWGYVMWDRSSLDNCGVFEAEWEQPDAVPSTADEIRRDEQRQASLDRRGKIYRMGGRGWWSFEDESKIVWPIGKSPLERAALAAKRERETTKEPKSLEEARSFLLGWKHS